MADQRPSLTTPPTSPRLTLLKPISPSSPRPFPLVPPAQVGTHPRHPTHKVNLPVEFPLSPATIDLAFAQGKTTSKQVLLELEDGSSFTGFSFGAAKSVSGELVFQTGLTPSHLLA
jgi:hypothetical protein